VTQEGVFAIVGDESGNNPGDYFAQQHVPFFGGGFDFTYCSNTPSTKVLGFSFSGCIIPVAQMLTGNNGKAPDVIFCQMSTDCIGIYTLLRPRHLLGRAGEADGRQRGLRSLRQPAGPHARVQADEGRHGRLRGGLLSKIDFGSLVGYTSTDRPTCSSRR
jgi:hypothetical protein